MQYEMEELIPIVAKLTEKYTSKESSSITYEMANQLMGAVLYCINECEGVNELAGNGGLSASDAYRIGYDRVILKAKMAQEQYNQMVVRFHAFGNENYGDTVLKAIPAFFRLYDPRFAPQENIITMDYPVLARLQDVSGIDAIEKYIACIDLEQQFMHAFPEEYVYGVLFAYQKNYQKQFDNLCRVLLRHILGNILLGKKLEKTADKEDYIMLKKIITGQSKLQLKDILDRAILQMIAKNWSDRPYMAEYLKQDIDDFIVDLQYGAENDTLEKILVL